MNKASLSTTHKRFRIGPTGNIHVYVFPTALSSKQITEIGAKNPKIYQFISPIFLRVCVRHIGTIEDRLTPSLWKQTLF